MPAPAPHWGNNAAGSPPKVGSLASIDRYVAYSTPAKLDHLVLACPRTVGTASPPPKKDVPQLS